MPYMNNDEVLVSISCITYNHVNFIKQCIDSFLMQKTNFKYEILIHDDCSTDGTTEIIKEYEKKYPDIIKPIYETENQYSKGIYVSREFQYPRVKSKYLALCEGDDYWTDPYKLQKQIDFLETHPEFTGCFHPVKVIWEDQTRPDEIYPTEEIINNRTEITKDELLNMNYIQTNSVVYRWRFKGDEVKKYIPNNIIPGDWYLHLLHSQKGNFAYIDEIMSVYRKHNGGIWQDEPDVRTLKYSYKVVNFYYNVWKNIADSSDDYLYRILLPTMRYVMNVCLNNDDTEKIRTIVNMYPELKEKLLDFDIYLNFNKFKNEIEYWKNENNKIKQNFELLLNEKNKVQEDFELLQNENNIIKQKNEYFENKNKIYQKRCVRLQTVVVILSIIIISLTIAILL